MTEPAEDRLAALEAELAETRERLDVASEQLARIEPLLRAILKRAPRRAERIAAAPTQPSAGVLSEEQREAIRKKMRRRLGE